MTQGGTKAEVDLLCSRLTEAFADARKRRAGRGKTTAPHAVDEGGAHRGT